MKSGMPSALSAWPRRWSAKKGPCRFSWNACYRRVRSPFTNRRRASCVISIFPQPQCNLRPSPPGIIILKSLKDRSKTVQTNAGASLIDLGDGIVCCEFHAKMNAIGGDIVAMIYAGLKRLETDFEAMVIANQAANFSVGANIMLLLVSAQEEEWDDLHMAVRQFQRCNMAIKYSPRPVVVAPHGMSLGGGCEIPLHGARIHAAAETLHWSG